VQDVVHHVEYGIDDGFRGVLGPVDQVDDLPDRIVEHLAAIGGDGVVEAVLLERETRADVGARRGREDQQGQGSEHHEEPPHRTSSFRGSA
jgi:hypothetical protein